MCGRVAITNADKANLKAAFKLKRIAVAPTVMHNLAPGAPLPVILNEAPDELNAALWGLVPSWAKESKSTYKMINAVSETVFEKPAYRGPIRKKRCLVLVDAFYEWKKMEDGKQPYCIRMKSKETFSFAGVWDLWEKDGNALLSCSILTCGPNRLMKNIHDRMPVILKEADRLPWLNAQKDDEIRSFLSPLKEDLLEAYPVSKMVNSTSNQGEEVMKRIDLN